jgi:hypothetical protein
MLAIQNGTHAAIAGAKTNAVRPRCIAHPTAVAARDDRAAIAAKLWVRATFLSAFNMPRYAAPGAAVANNHKLAQIATVSARELLTFSA